jgi:hypothetical protein
VISDQFQDVPRQAIRPKNIRGCLLCSFHVVTLSLFGAFLQDSRSSDTVAMSDMSFTHRRRKSTCLLLKEEVFYA